MGEQSFGAPEPLDARRFPFAFFLNARYRKKVLPPLATVLSRRDDSVYMASSSGPIDSEVAQHVEAELKEAGFLVGKANSLSQQCLSGTAADRARAADINYALRNQDIKHVLLLSQRYGAARVLPYLETTSGASDTQNGNATVIVGDSDATAVLTQMARNESIVAVYRSYLAQNTINHGATMRTAMALDAKKTAEVRGVKTLRAGVARAPLMGGKLSAVASLLGTPYDPLTSPCVLLLEEDGEDLEFMDRLLDQLFCSRWRGNIKAIVFGSFRASGRDRDALTLVERYSALVDCPSVKIETVRHVGDGLFVLGRETAIGFA